MSKRAKALTAGVVLAACGIGVIASGGKRGTQADKPSSAKPTTRAKAPAMPPLKPTSQPMIEITPEQEAELLAALKESSPEHYYAYLMAMKKSGNEALYRRSLAHAWRTYEQWRNAPKHVREQVLAEREASIEIGKLVDELRHARSAAIRGELTAKLRQAIARRFEAEVVIRDYRLTQFEQRIKTLREELAERIKNRDRHIDDRYETWLKRAEETPDTPPGK